LPEFVERILDSFVCAKIQPEMCQHGFRKVTRYLYVEVVMWPVTWKTEGDLGRSVGFPQSSDSFSSHLKKEDKQAPFLQIGRSK
jgi:hypothetical protein